MTTTVTIGQQVADLQARIIAAQRERIRAETTRDAAKASAEQARAELLRDFGIATSIQAQDLLDTLRADLELITAEISAALDKVGV